MATTNSRGVNLIRAVSLSRAQISQLATYFAIDGGIHSVTITESNSSGIGLNHYAQFHKEQSERSFEADITDVGNW
jgi:hypothetical protein